MTGSSRGNLAARLAAEFVVIVLGVLVALAADAYLENRGDREREFQVLRTLSEDLATSIADLRTQSENTRHRSTTLSAYIAHADSAPDGVPADSAYAIMAAANITGAYSPILRGYEALISAGSLDLIENPEVLLRLAFVKQQAEEYLDYREQTTDGWIFTLMPVWLRVMGEGRPDALPVERLRAALGDGEFVAATGQRATFLRLSAQGGFELVEAMESAKALIDEELATRFDYSPSR